MYGMASFDTIRTFSLRMDEPTKASRLFDKDRDGLVPSGGVTFVLEDYDQPPYSIDYINAHATSTPQGDTYESKALVRLSKDEHAMISSTKSMTGHECWMTGASEVVYSVIMMQNNFVASNINFENPDEYSKELNITATTTDTELHCVLSNSFDFGGTNSDLIIKKV